MSPSDCFAILSSFILLLSFSVFNVISGSCSEKVRDNKNLINVVYKKLGILVLGPTDMKWNSTADISCVLVLLPISLKLSILGDGVGLLSMPASIACPPPLHCPLTSSHIHRTYTHRRTLSTHSASHFAELITRSSVKWHVCTNEAR